MSDIKQTTVEGELRWVSAHPDKPTEDFNGNPVWSCDVIVPKSTCEKFKKHGLIKQIKQTKEGEYVLKFKCPTVSSKGRPMNPPTVVHEEGYLIEGDTIGNGSTGRVTISIIPYDNRFGKGYTLRLKKIEVIDHQIYEGAGEAEEFEF